MPLPSRRYIVSRLGQMVVTLWAFLTILFVLVRALPGDPTAAYVIAGMSSEARMAMIERLGLDQPLHIQYVRFLTSFVQGNFGYSWQYNAPVTEILAIKFANTIILMLLIVFFSYLFGMLIGAYFAWRRGTLQEKAGVVLTLFDRSMPLFWLAFIFILVFVSWLDFFPVGGMRSVSADSYEGFLSVYLSTDFLHHLVLPAMVGIVYRASDPTLLMRNSMLEVLSADFIEAEKAQGLSTWTILYNHAMRNSILPLLTHAALTFGRALGGMVILEVVFDWPGMGRELVLAVNSNDYPLAIAAFFMMGVTVILLNFIADLGYAYLDPRVSYE